MQQTTTTKTMEPMNQPNSDQRRSARKQEKKAANDRLKAQKERNKAVNHDNKAANAVAQPQ